MIEAAKVIGSVLGGFLVTSYVIGVAILLAGLWAGAI